MNSRPKLYLNWAGHTAAKFAVERWHYSERLPAGKSVKIGVWEDRKFIGVVMFGMGAGNATNGKQYGLSASHEMAELTRVALANHHKTAVSRIIAIAIKMLRRQSPGVRLLISFADEMGQGHYGGIYQAGNWLYSGAFEGNDGFMIHGKIIHNRTVGAKGWKQQIAWLRANIDPGCYRVANKKHRYLMPLDDEMRHRVEPLRKPYPKREKQAMAGPPAQRRCSADLHAPRDATLEGTGETFPLIKGDEDMPAIQAD